LPGVRIIVLHKNNTAATGYVRRLRLGQYYDRWRLQGTWEEDLDRRASARLAGEPPVPPNCVAP
jgi:hypothetical protein